MKKTHFIFVGCLLVAAVLSLFALTRISSEQKGQDQNGAVQTSLTHQRRITGGDARTTGIPNGSSRRNNSTSAAKSNARPDRRNGPSETLKTPAGRPAAPSSKPVVGPVVSANPAPKIDGRLFENLSGLDGGLDLPVSQNDRSVAPAETAAETESDHIDHGSYTDSPEVYGQDGKKLPFPEAVLARKRQDILQYHNKTEAVIIEEHIDTDTDSAPADKQTVAENTDNTPENQDLSDDTVDVETRTNRLLADLAETNPVDVRLQAIYLLADVAPDRVKLFLNDREDVIRFEAQRIMGIYPEK